MYATHINDNLISFSLLQNTKLPHKKVRAEREYIPNIVSWVFKAVSDTQ